MLKPPADAGVALAKKTDWRVFKKPPAIAELAGEPTGSVLTAIMRVVIDGTSDTRRVLVIKTGAHRWLSVTGESYDACVVRWRDEAKSAKPNILDDAAIPALIPQASYAWCINRMYAAKPRRVVKRGATNAAGRRRT